MTSAGELCSRTVIVIRNDEPLLEAAKLMREHHVGDVVVVVETDRGRVPIGMLTDRDMVIDAMATRPDQLESLLVRDVARSQVLSVGEHDRVSDALKQMRASSVRRVPVVSREGTLVGILSLDDILELLATELLDVARLATKQREREEQRIG